ncbi:NADH-quinone oxidoreductase subunit C [Denitratisoma oestradiolicum]|uniref:NADH-quinone oxidoreductase subunit C n=1 Tax=Denitratisoma oestradiolicum TaxID=311182 RepID=A0A6S6XQ80_9PROT|nr:NADH-quinone oxidoreductase subunit C [Denitratisoma oestradiolicum]TWO79410.1 NADH-quinone oxidoreductase subunit C [Denitratisoma oestradiolicum]CAB1368116.1 NADH-quinone oxidoreductase subunit C [Denitratisoma oestradiolicum]
MSAKLERLCQNLQQVLGGRLLGEPVLARGEVTVEVAVGDYLDVARRLRDHEHFHFDQLIDLCGVDYSEYNGRTGPRYGVVSHLNSVALNQQLRLRTFAADEEFPVVPSLVDIWNGVNWFEREAFDLYGVHFDGHPDLRRILTDYGFVGHPFRKDFPVSGYVEMRYDPEQRRVIYEPVSIEPREVTPRIVREGGYGRG